MGFFGYNKKLLQADPSAPIVFDLNGNKRNDAQKFMQWSAGNIYQSYKNSTYWWKDSTTNSLNTAMFADSLFYPDKFNSFVSDIFTSNENVSMPDVLDDIKKTRIGTVYDPPDGTTDKPYPAIDLNSVLTYIVNEFSKITNIRNTTLSVLNFKNNEEYFSDYTGVGIINANSFPKTTNNAKPVSLKLNSSTVSGQKKYEVSIISNYSSLDASITTALRDLNLKLTEYFTNGKLISEKSMEDLRVEFKNLLNCIRIKCPCIYTFPKDLPPKKTYKFVYHYSKFLGHNSAVSTTDTFQIYTKKEYSIGGAEKLLLEPDKSVFNAMPNSSKGWIIGTASTYNTQKMTPDLTPGQKVFIGDPTLMKNPSETSKQVSGWILDSTNCWSLHLYPCGIPIKVQFYSSTNDTIKAWRTPSGYSNPDGSYNEITMVVGQTVKLPKIGKSNATDTPLRWASGHPKSSETVKESFLGFAIKNQTGNPDYQPGYQIQLGATSNLYTVIGGVNHLKIFPKTSKSITYGFKRGLTWNSVNSFESADTNAQAFNTSYPHKQSARTVAPSTLGDNINNSPKDNGLRISGYLKDTSDRADHITIKMEDLGFDSDDCKNISQISFDITGWINEQAPSHAPLVWAGYCRIYIDDIVIGNGSNSWSMTPDELKFVQYNNNLNDTKTKQYTPSYAKGFPTAGSFNGSNAPVKSNGDPNNRKVLTNANYKSYRPKRLEPFCLFEYIGHKYMTTYSEWAKNHGVPKDQNGFDQYMGTKKYEDSPKISFVWERPPEHPNNSIKWIKFYFLRKEYTGDGGDTRGGSIGMVYVGKVSVIA